VKISWVPGAAHGAPHTIAYTAFTIRVRLGCGFGAEAFNAGPLRQTFWLAGALECMPPAVEHAHTTGVDADWLSVAFDAAEWEEIAGCAANGRLLRCDAGRRYVQYPRLVHAVHGLMAAAPADAEFLRQALGAEVAGAYRSMVVHAPREREPATLSSATLKRLADFVEEHLHVGITLEQMAKQARLSKFHFTSAFRRAAGSTPYQYVVGRRLARARKLLRGTRAPITDLALECGFSSHAHLTSTFTARYGVSPAVYRRLTSVQSSGG